MPEDAVERDPVAEQQLGLAGVIAACVPSAGSTATSHPAADRRSNSIPVISPARECSRVWSGGTSSTRLAPAAITSVAAISSTIPRSSSIVMRVGIASHVEEWVRHAAQDAGSEK